MSLVGAIPEWKWPPLLGLGLADHPGPAGRPSLRSSSPGAWRLAPAAVLAPFDYTSIVLAVAFGYLWFKEEPSWTVWYGLPLVIGSGLYILYRERGAGTGSARRPFFLTFISPSAASNAQH